MSRRYGIVLLLLATLTAFLVAVAHMSCIYFGPQCYAAQMAPPFVVESARAGTLMAPLLTLAVSAIFILLGCYALSAARFIRRLPFLRLGIYSISAVCIVRGVLPIQLFFRYPEKISDPVLIAGIVWLLVGLCYLFGFRAVKKHTMH
ncbi:MULTISPECIES: hypothetical protein [unclassified Pseudoalteromonas]|uniref:hypothetical protein n=1 Tax=unclassified Pseudoalteromonas TaxID=194690 RepID=UPI0020986002|nr:hypothetical protein [Pseudoalteromonas sp. XMcav2-N]MCO7187895.1 hypothetical protein [Pseudoalteromonas sp. XMcav2-N]